MFDDPALSRSFICSSGFGRTAAEVDGATAKSRIVTRGPCIDGPRKYRNKLKYIHCRLPFSAAWNCLASSKVVTHERLAAPKGWLGPRCMRAFFHGLQRSEQLRVSFCLQQLLDWASPRRNIFAQVRMQMIISTHGVSANMCERL